MVAMEMASLQFEEGYDECYLPVLLNTWDVIMTLTSLFSLLLSLALKLISTSLVYPLGTFLTFVSTVIKFSENLHMMTF